MSHPPEVHHLLYCRGFCLFLTQTRWRIMIVQAQIRVMRGWSLIVFFSLWRQGRHGGSRPWFAARRQLAAPSLAQLAAQMGRPALALQKHLTLEVLEEGLVTHSPASKATVCVVVKMGRFHVKVPYPPRFCSCCPRSSEMSHLNHELFYLTEFSPKMFLDT